MFSRLAAVAGIALFFIGGGTDALAQNTVLKDASNAIRARDIGTAYSGAAINAQTLSALRGNINRPAGVQATVVNSSLIGPGAQRPTKPFANVQPRSTVSPYLNLFNEGLNDNADNYTTLVRPMLNQQRRNQQFQQAGQQLQRQNQALNARFQALSAQPAYAPQGNANIFSTGHRTLYNNTSHYYPGRR